jgi:hypothetical protein
MEHGGGEGLEEAAKVAMNAAEGKGSRSAGEGLGLIGGGEGPDEGPGAQESPSLTVALGHGLMTCRRRWPRK